MYLMFHEIWHILAMHADKPRVVTNGILSLVPCHLMHTAEEDYQSP